MLAALAAVNTMVVSRGERRPHQRFYVGPEWIAVGLCVAIVAARRSLLLGLVLAAALIAILRALEVVPLPA